MILDRTVDSDSDLRDVSLAESDLLLNDPVRLNSLLKMAGYAITLHPQKLMTVTDELYPWVYVGVRRSGNTTVGYRVHHLAEEFVISPEVPEALDWFPTEDFDKWRHFLRKGHKLVSLGKFVDSVDLDE